MNIDCNCELVRELESTQFASGSGYRIFERPKNLEFASRGYFPGNAHSYEKDNQTNQSVDRIGGKIKERRRQPNKGELQNRSSHPHMLRRRSLRILLWI